MTASPAKLPAIRLMSTEDLPAYKALRDAGLHSNPDAFTSDFDTASVLPAASYATRLGQPPQDHFMLGAFDDAGALVGAVVCERQARLKKRHEVELVGMIVAPEWRGRGLARALLDEFDRQVRRLPGVEHVILSVTASNERVVRLYEAAGFARYGQLPRALKIGDAYYDKLLMVKQL